MKMFYLENKERGPRGNKILWWAKNNHGYTCDINEAKEFTEQEADKILSTSSAKYNKHEVEYIKSIATPYVDPQYLKKSDHVIIDIDAEEKVRYKGQVLLKRARWEEIKKELDAGAESNDFIEELLNKQNSWFESTDFEITDYKEAKGE